MLGNARSPASVRPAAVTGAPEPPEPLTEGDRPEPLTEGERWTRTELARLREARWRPRASIAFFAAAQARANFTRGRRPGLAGQEAAWILIGAIAWLLAAPSLSGGARCRARGLAWWTGCALMLDWHLGMLETPEGRAVKLGPADALTLTRAWLVPAVSQRADPWLVLLGGLTDAADGRVARATRCTRFGRDLEGLVDACFTAAALRAAVRAGELSPLPARVERARLLGGAGYAAGAYFVRGRAPDRTGGRIERLAAPVRVAALVAAGSGQRRGAGGLLLTGSGLAVVGLCRRTARPSPPPSPASGASATTARYYDAQLALERRALRTAIELAAPHRDELVLDLGTGTGALLRLLARRAGRPARAVGIDASRAMLSHVPPLPAGWQLIEADARTLPLGDASVDVITCAYLLHLLGEPARRAVLAELARVLRPRGRAVIVTLLEPRGTLGRALLAPGQRALCRVLGAQTGWCQLDPTAELADAGLRPRIRRVCTRGYASLCVLVERS